MSDDIDLLLFNKKAERAAVKYSGGKSFGEIVQCAIRGNVYAYVVLMWSGLLHKYPQLSPIEASDFLINDTNNPDAIKIPAEALEKALERYLARR